MSFRQLIAILSGAAVSSLGILGVLGYIFHRVAYYAWGGIGKPGMGLNTAIAFTLTGVALVLVSVGKNE